MDRFINFYECPYCGKHWEDRSECITADYCPECGAKNIEPYESKDTEED